MHDGSMATLADVIDFYATGGAGCASEEKVGLSSRDRQRLIAFLVSLTGANVANLGQDARAAFVNY